MRYLVFLILSGCSININNLPPPTPVIYQPPVVETVSGCPTYVPPEVAELPRLPQINQLDVSDRIAVEKLLIQLIKEHREYIHTARQTHDKHYQDYLLACNQN